MSMGKKILVSILISFFVSNVYAASVNKHKTSSQIFLKLRSNQASQCNFINHDFDKLTGVWYYVLRTVTSKTAPEIRCGHLVVKTIYANGFIAELDYMNGEDEIVRVPMSGVFLNETVSGVPELDNLMTVDPNLEKPYKVQMGICDNDTIFFIEPIYYQGGAMVFTRNIPQSITALKLRFGTYDEQRGKEQMVQIPFDCNV